MSKHAAGFTYFHVIGFGQAECWPLHSVRVPPIGQAPMVGVGEITLEEVGSTTVRNGLAGSSAGSISHVRREHNAQLGIIAVALNRLDEAKATGQPPPGNHRVAEDRRPVVDGRSERLPVINIFHHLLSARQSVAPAHEEDYGRSDERSHWTAARPALSLPY